MVIESSEIKQKLSEKEARKRDALALANIIYDCFKEAKRNASIGPGQKDAKKIT